MAGDGDTNPFALYSQQDQHSEWEAKRLEKALIQLPTSFSTPIVVGC